MATSTQKLNFIGTPRSCQTTSVNEKTLMKMHGINVQLPVLCDFCSKKFYNLDKFDDHMSTHQECQYFSCQLCNNTFQSWGNLVAHRKACHHGQVLSCEGCSKRKSHSNLRVVTFPIGNFAHGCEECCEGFNSMHDLTRHYCHKHGPSDLYVHPLKPHAVGNECKSIYVNLVCPLCKKIFKSLENLMFHVKMLSLTMNLKHFCVICKTKFCNKQLLREHLNMHSKSLPQVGDIKATSVCRNLQSLETSDKLSLKKSVVTMLSSVRKNCYACPICKLVFTLEASLQLHIKLHRPNAVVKKNNFDCVMPKSSLRRSMKHEEAHEEQVKSVDNASSILKTGIHSESKLMDCESDIKKKPKYICEYCGHEFQKKGNLMSHIQRHRNERTFSCKYCLKSFFTNQQLSIHKYKHSGERPYICEVTLCKKSFSSPTALYMHRKIHKPTAYKCQYCKKEFFYQSSYIGHIRLHTGLRPFSCALCDKTFTVRGKLNLHIKLKHQVSQFRCSDCGNYFITKEELSSHCNDHCCVTLVTMTNGGESDNSGADANGKQYIIIY